MNPLTEWVLTGLAANGVPLLLFIAFIGSLGIPFPITMVIVGAGALARAGLLDWRWASLACLAGAVLADSGEYWLGRLAQSWLRQRLAPKAVWQQAQSIIKRQGGWAILLTRFWLTPLAPAINVLAGCRYSFWRFLLLDVAGQCLWVLLYGGLGYLFAAQWEWVSQALGAFSGMSVALALLAFGAWLWLPRRKAAAKSH